MNDYSVLVVDDSTSIRILVESTLNRYGFKVHTATNGQAAWELLNQIDIDIVISDLLMPIMSGSTLCQKLKSSEKLRHIMFIMLTSMDSLENKLDSLELGADDYITKPCNPQELIARVKALLRICELNRQVNTSNKKLRAYNNRLIRLSTQLRKANQHINDEYQVVANIQLGLLPSQYPQIAGYQFSTFYIPSEKAGGDYYDFFPQSDGKWGITIADVSGHGVSSAVIMAMTRVILHYCARLTTQPEETLGIANDYLFDNVMSCHIITMICATLDPQTNTLRSSSAGHHPIMIYRPQTNSLFEVTGNNSLPLLVIEAHAYNAVTTQLMPGDLVLLYTDGIIEALSPQGEEYGVEKLQEFVIQNHLLELDLFTSTLYSELQQFRGRKNFSDDITLIAIRVEYPN